MSRLRFCDPLANQIGIPMVGALPLVVRLNRVADGLVPDSGLGQDGTAQSDRLTFAPLAAD